MDKDTATMTPEAPKTDAPFGSGNSFAETGISGLSGITETAPLGGEKMPGQDLFDKEGRPTGKFQELLGKISDEVRQLHDAVAATNSGEVPTGSGITNMPEQSTGSLSFGPKPDASASSVPVFGEGVKTSLPTNEMISPTPQPTDGGVKMEPVSSSPFGMQTPPVESSGPIGTTTEGMGAEQSAHIPQPTDPLAPKP